MKDKREDPDQILKRIRNEETEKTRGLLKIFFGYAAGVGKTYTMLQAAHEARRKGIDVVAGYIEPHTRPETFALTRGLELLPRREVVHGGMRIKEFDIDAAIERHPQLILVDELAHTNAPGSRHAKRYQDVEELLNNGIDVYTTINVQHIESLNDIVSSITGIQVRERIPDSVFDKADQVEIIDIEPAELLDRLRSGHVYRKVQAQRAMENFFTLENLTALREISLRRCADHVNVYSESTGIKSHDDYHTDEHILVFITPDESNTKIIRTAARMASAFRGEFTGVFVETPEFSSISDEDLKRLRENMRLAEQLGAKVETVYGTDLAFQIAEFARLQDVSKLVIARSVAIQGKIFEKQTLVEKISSQAPQLDIHIIPDFEKKKYYHAKSKKPAIAIADVLKTIGVLIAASLVGSVFYREDFDNANIIIIYVFAVLVISIITRSRICSLGSSIVSVLLFNFLFTVPRFSLEAYDKGYPVTFFVMFLTAFLTSSLAIKLKEHAKQAALVTFRTKILLGISQSLQQAQDRDEIEQVTADQLIKLLDKDIVFYPAENGTLGEPKIYYDNKDNQSSTGIYTSDKERTVALWVLKNNKHAGSTTQTLSDSRCLYLAVRVKDRVYGVLGIALNGEPLETFQKSILLSILGECALALENDKNAREKEEAAVIAKNEQLRSNLLRAISHDLRTPLTSISGNASNFLYNGDSLDEETKKKLFTDIYDDSMWLINLVENLLSVTRLEEGRINLRITSELVSDVIEESLRHVSRKKTEHNINVTYEDEFLLARMDAKLIVQVIINIVDNAIKYTPVDSNIDINVRERKGWAVISIADNGSGISDEAKAKVFDMFYCGSHKIADSRRSLGLGLSLCRSIISAHGGALSVRDNKPTGAVFEFTLPIGEVTIHE